MGNLHTCIRTSNLSFNYLLIYFHKLQKQSSLWRTHVAVHTDTICHFIPHLLKNKSLERSLSKCYSEGQSSSANIWMERRSKYSAETITWFSLSLWVRIILVVKLHYSIYNNFYLPCWNIP